MKKVGIRALKQNASAVVAEAAAGETIVITDRGEPVAQMLPYTEGRLAALEAAGILRRATGSIRDLPPPLELDGPSLGETLEEMRSEERD
jgi:prevent-host-death family protein